MEQLYQQGEFFLASVITGIGILFVYDFFRILRCVWKPGKWRIFFEDFLFWTVSGVVVFLVAYQVNQGKLRSFCVIGLGLGMWLYHNGPSTFFVYIVSKCIKKIRKVIRTVFGYIVKHLQQLR